MRVSVRTSDRGYAAYMNLRLMGYSCLVFLDDKPVSYCLMADEEMGEVERTVLNSAGRPVVDRGTDTVLTEVVRGTVRIELYPIHDRAQSGSA